MKITTTGDPQVMLRDLKMGEALLIDEGTCVWVMIRIGEGDTIGSGDALVLVARTGSDNFHVTRKPTSTRGFRVTVKNLDVEYTS